MGRTKTEYINSEKFYNYLVKLFYEDEKLYKYIYDIKVLNEELNLKQIKLI